MGYFNLVGRMEQKPEVKKSQNGYTYSSFLVRMPVTYKTSSNEKEETMISLVAWGNVAEEIGKNFNKNDLVTLRGHLSSNSYKKDDGTIYYHNDLVVEKCSLLQV